MPNRKRANPRLFKTEAELVAAARDWLRADGYDCYFEVAPWGGGGPRADIVGTKGPLLAVVECKMSLGLAVLEQCRYWTTYANIVWAAVPWQRSTGGMAHWIADAIGCGVVELGAHGQQRFQTDPKLRRKVNCVMIRDVLCQAQRDTTPGARSGFRTPYQATCSNLLDIVTRCGRMEAKAVMNELAHHYSSTACARSTLIKRAEQGVVPGVRVVRDLGRIWFETK